jgi:hypothetical protein
VPSFGDHASNITDEERKIYKSGRVLYLGYHGHVTKKKQVLSRGVDKSSRYLGRGPMYKGVSVARPRGGWVIYED